jgi:hypothetical protein
MFLTKTLIVFISLVSSTASAQLPCGPLSIQTASLYALASYCAILYEKDHKEYDCGYECAGETEGSILALAYTEPKSMTRLLITYNHKLKTIVFQSKGMQDIKEIYKSLQIVTTKLNDKSSFGHEPGIKLHSGFRKINEELRFTSMPTLLRLSRKYPDYKIVFVGHSLGGGIALLAAVDYYELYGNADRISVYTFGKPRIGNNVWAHYVNRLPFVDRIFRMTRYGDPFTLFPPRFMGYEQEMQAYQVQSDGSFLKCKSNSNSGESDECSFPIWKYHLRAHNDYYELKAISCEQFPGWQRRV